MKFHSERQSLCPSIYMALVSAYLWAHVVQAPGAQAAALRASSTNRMQHTGNDNLAPPWLAPQGLFMPGFASAGTQADYALWGMHPGIDPAHVAGST